MKLTKLERDILNHRLEVVGDSMTEIDPIDILTPDEAETADGLNQYHPVDVEGICNLLLEGKFNDALACSDSITNDILVDCVEGSTYWAAADGQGGYSEQRLGQVKRAGDSLAKKVQGFTGIERELEFPNY